MIESAQGIILRTRLLTETSLIVNWLTRDHGRLSTVAKGARRLKSAFRGKLDLLFVADFTFARSRRSDLHTLRELGLRQTFEPLRHELSGLQQAAYCTRLIEQTVEPEAAVPGIYDLMLGLLQTLSQAPTQPQTVFAFEFKLLGELGLFPDLDDSRLTPKARQAAASMLSSAWDAIHPLRLPPALDRELDQFLHGFLIYHLGKIPKDRSAAIRARASLSA